MEKSELINSAENYEQKAREVRNSCDFYAAPSLALHADSLEALASEYRKLAIITR
jgi:hypothetical protein